MTCKNSTMTQKGKAWFSFIAIHDMSIQLGEFKKPFFNFIAVVRLLVKPLFGRSNDTDKRTSHVWQSICYELFSFHLNMQAVSVGE